MTWVRRPRPASLRPGIDDTSTIDGAKWAAVLVSEVTLFVVFSALDAIAAEWLHEVIAAGGVLAERRAAVGVVLVAVVAGLVRAYEPVTAACEQAGVQAFVGVVLITVVALDAGTENSAAARAGSTVVRTAILVDVVTVVARFVRRLEAVTA